MRGRAAGLLRGAHVAAFAVAGVSDIAKWDEAIQDVCLQVNRVVEGIEAAAPEWVQAQAL